MIILITAASSPAFVSISQYLRSRGHSVIGIANKFNPASNANCNKYIVGPDSTSPDYYDLIDSLEFDIGLSWIDEEIPLIQTRLQKKRSSFIVVDLNQFVILNNKNKFYEWCLENKFSVLPKTSKVPAFIRRAVSRGSKGARQILEQENLDKYLNNPEFIIQKVIGNSFKEYTIDVLSDHSGNLLECSPRERSVASNVSLQGVVNRNPIAISLAEALSKALKIPGIWNIQAFINDNHYYLVEINPRMAGSIIFSINSGMNFSDYLVGLSQRNCNNFKPSDYKEIQISRYYQEYYE